MVNSNFTPPDKKPGDLILSADWNAAMGEIKRLEKAKVNREGADTLKGPLTIQEALNVTGNVSMKGELDVNSAIKAGNSDIYFTKTDHNHTGFGNTQGYAAIENAKNHDCLMILGRAGTDKGRTVKLWDYLQVNGDLDVTGNVSMKGELDVNSAIKAGNSDIYFTKTDHNHTGFGNTQGYAAIENAKNHDCLMILGRAGTDKGRKVKLWDYLQVNGDLDVTGNLGVEGRIKSKNIRSQVTANDSVNTASSTWVDMPNMSVNVTTGNSPVLVLFKTGGVQCTGGQNDNKLARAKFRLLIDNNEKAATIHEFNQNGWELRDITLHFLDTLTDGSHRINIQWLIDAGVKLSACWYRDLRSLIVLEL